jgi:hypothetical protein
MTPASVKTPDHPEPVAAPAARRAPAPFARIRETSFADYDRIAALMSRNGLTAKPYRNWVRLWENNPAYERHGRGPIGWVLEAEGGDVVGALSVIPSSYLFRGRELRAASCGDWAVDPAYRTRSLLLLKKFSESPNLDLLLSTTVAPNAETGFRFCNWRRAPVGVWDESAVWVTSYRALLKAALARISAPISGLRRIPAWLMSRNGAPHGPRPRMEVGDRFDSRFDEFWDASQRGREGVLLGVRTRGALEWHYSRLMDLGRLRIVTASLNSRMEAYAVFERRDIGKPGIGRAMLVDVQTTAGQESLTRHILRFAFEELRAEGIDVVENIGGWLRGPDIPKPFYRALPGWLYYYKANDEELAKALEDPAAWAPSCFDGDLCL